MENGGCRIRIIMAEVIKVDGQHNGLFEELTPVKGVNALMGTFDLPADHFVTFQSERPGFVKIGLKNVAGDTPCTIDRSIEVDITDENFVQRNVLDGNFYKPTKRSGDSDDLVLKRELGSGGVEFRIFGKLSEDKIGRLKTAKEILDFLIPEEGLGDN